jgi:hypothetical protein
MNRNRKRTSLDRMEESQFNFADSLMPRDQSVNNNPRDQLVKFQLLKTNGGTQAVANAFMTNVDNKNKPQARVYQRGNFETDPSF